MSRCKHEGRSGEPTAVSLLALDFPLQNRVSEERATECVIRARQKPTFACGEESPRLQPTPPPARLSRAAPSSDQGVSVTKKGPLPLLSLPNHQPLPTTKKDTRAERRGACAAPLRLVPSIGSLEGEPCCELHLRIKQCLSEPEPYRLSPSSREDAASSSRLTARLLLSALRSCQCRRFRVLPLPAAFVVSPCRETRRL